MIVHCKTALPDFNLACQGCGKRWSHGDLMLIGRPKMTWAIFKKLLSMRLSLAKMQLAVGECCFEKLIEVHSYGGAITGKNVTERQIRAARVLAKQKLKKLGIGEVHSEH